MSTHANTQTLLPLGEPTPDERVFVNGSLWFVDSNGYRVVFFRHEPIYRAALSDKVHLRMIAVALRQSRLATQEDIAVAFGHSQATQRRWESQYGREGIDGLMPKKPPGMAPRLDCSQEALVSTWFSAGVSNRVMAKRLGVDEATIRRTLKRLGLVPSLTATPTMLPEIDEQTAPAETVAPAETDDGQDSEPAEVALSVAVNTTSSPEGKECGVEVLASPSAAPPWTVDADPCDRSGDRALARMGLLDDAAPLFADAQCLPRAGVLLAMPLLVRHGLIEVFADVYDSLHPSFYGLRTILVTLFLAALLRIKQPEQFKEYRPQDLGAIVGLDRAPEVKTVRRKLARLAAMGRAKQLMEALAQRRIAEDDQRVAFLYLDGHVREYHGKHRLFQTKKAQRQVVTPAATDTWVHDASGEPLLVVPSEANAKLTQVLEPILTDVRRLVGDQRRITVIFDRGGFSPKLFARLIEAGFDVITYRKGKTKKLASTQFTLQREKIDGTWREYQIADRPRVRVGVLSVRKRRGKARSKRRYLWMREVRILRNDDRQTAVLTSREDLSAVMVAYRIFFRWRQENYFKYMEEEFALDALVEYGAEDVPETIDCRNPEWLRLTSQLRETRAEIKRLQSEIGQEVEANAEGVRRTIRGFKIAHAELRRRLQEAEAKAEKLFQQRKQVPARIPAHDRQMLKPERKLIADAIKMAAYQVETELLGMLQDHYSRVDEEGRTLLQAAFQSPARLEVVEDELRVTIASQSSPHRTAALAALCAQLDTLAVLFPGTQLRLRLAVEGHEPLIS
jgi:transposase